MSKIRARKKTLNFSVSFGQAALQHFARPEADFLLVLVNDLVRRLLA